MIKKVLKTVAPDPMWRLLQKSKRKLLAVALEDVLEHMDGKDILPVFDRFGLNVSRTTDYYSPLPVLTSLASHRERWFRPSSMPGVSYDIKEMNELLGHLVSEYGKEYAALPPYEEVKTMGYGPGFTIVDAMIAYFMIRDIKPRRYIEVGSGMSTWYCLAAAHRNAESGRPLRMTCVDPYPTKTLRSQSEIDVIPRELQDMDLDFFQQLDAGDVLFIDSTHIVKIDGEVPLLYLEILPRLKKGVVIHVHDIPFPFNVPFPPDFYVLGGLPWPVFWTEPMLLQALLCNNHAFTIRLSAPLLRFHAEEFLKATLPVFTPLECGNTDTHFCSIWIEKVEA